jgi:hypothetical protein
MKKEKKKGGKNSNESTWGFLCENDDEHRFKHSHNVQNAQNIGKFLQKPHMKKTLMELVKHDMSNIQLQST